MTKHTYLHPDFYLGERAKSAYERTFFNALKVSGEVNWEVYFKRNSYLPPATKAELSVTVTDHMKKLKTQTERDTYVKLVQSRTDVGFAMVCEAFKRNAHSRIYKVGHNFARAMAKMDVELQDSLIPKNFSGYFHFNSPAVKDRDGCDVVGIYAILEVIDQGSKEMLSHIRPDGTEYKHGDMALRIAYVGSKESVHATLTKEQTDFISENMTFGETGINMIKINMGKNVKESFVNLKDFDTGEVGIGIGIEDEPISRLAVNLIMYIHSLEPDVMHMKPVHEYNSKERNQLLKSGMTFTCSKYPISAVSWGYGQERQYRKDSTWVDSFPRWQPCGPGLSDRKLIFVKEHTRTFKKSETHKIERNERAET